MSAVTRPTEIGAHVGADGEPFGEWSIPGKGEAAPDCGRVSPQGFCDASGHIEMGYHDCGRRECPDCWSRQWAGPRTVTVVSRLAAAREAAEDPSDKRAVHAVVGPPPDDLPNTIEGFYRMRAEANTIAKEHGIRGGVVVPHGYRATDDTKARYKREDPNLSLWWWIRQNETPWGEQVYWSPHYHIIGLASSRNLDPETGQPGHIKPGEDREDGWLFKNIRSLDRYDGPNDIDGTEDMIRVIRYLLSHTTFPQNEKRMSVTWFGELHGCMFVPEEALTLVRWRKIQDTVERLVGSQADDDDEEDGEHTCKVDGCDGTVHDIFQARAYLDTVQGTIPVDMQRRILTAYEWKIGKVHPPPGMKSPRSVEEAREVLDHLLPTGDT